MQPQHCRIETSQRVIRLAARRHVNHNVIQWRHDTANTSAPATAPGEGVPVSRFWARIENAFLVIVAAAVAYITYTGGVL